MNDNSFDWIDKMLEEKYQQGKLDATRHGNWIKNNFGFFVCSECYSAARYNCGSYQQSKTRYCPQCGAKMTGVD